MRRLGMRRGGGVVRLVIAIVVAVVALRVMSAVVGAVLGLFGGLPLLLLIGWLVWRLADGSLPAWQRRVRARHGLVRGDGLPPLERVQLAFWQGVALVLKVFDRRENI